MDKRKKILIVYATAGIGHKKAASAVREALKAEDADVILKEIDILDYTNPFFIKAYPDVYVVLINKLIKLWAFMYYIFEIRIVHKLLYPLRKTIHLINARRLVRFLLEFKPDVILSTHFLLPDVCSYMKRKYGMNARVLNIVTDYRPHSFWISDGVDTYIVAHDITKKELVKKWGIEPNNIIVTGIPVEPKFSIKYDKASLRDKFNIPQSSFVVLLMSGGYGMGPVFEMVKLLNDLDGEISLITVCGYNKALYEKIENFKQASKINITNFGYVNNVNELMAASDVYVGKAGAISTTEALVQNLPIVFVNPIPGQESRNASFIAGKGAGIYMKDIHSIREIIAKLKQKENIDTMLNNVNKIKRPHAASDIAALVLKCAEGENK